MNCAHPKCRILLAPNEGVRFNYHSCAHCRQTFCSVHIVEHDKEVQLLYTAAKAIKQ